MLPFFTTKFGNAASRNHSFGWEAEQAVETAREQIAKLIGATAKEIIFTSGATESNNLAIKGIAEMYRERGNHIITQVTEHKAVLDTCKRLEKYGYRVTYLPVKADGLIDLEDLKRAMDDKTILVTIMAANNEIGVLQPIREIGKLCHEKGVIFHTDAVQAVGKVPVNVIADNIDVLSLSAHKIYGPKGVGALFVRRGTPLEPLLVGGSHERRRRAGTENVPGVVGLAKAAELAMLSLEDGTIPRLAALRDRLEAGILALPGTGVNGATFPIKRGAPGPAHLGTGETMNSIDCHPERAQRVEGPAVAFSSENPVPRIANTTNLWFDQIEGEALVIALDLKGIATSGGSACHSGATEPSHVLLAMGLGKTRARASLRFSLLRTATDADVDDALSVIPEAVAHLRAISPVAAGTAG
jgi:cysteine desulfurase